MVSGRLGNFNEKFDLLRTEIENALATTGVRVIAVQIHRGENGLGRHAINDLNEKKTELNETNERFDWKELKLADVYELFTEEIAQKSVDTKLEINNWHQLDNPHKAFYGTIPAKELIRLYSEFGRALFEKNIRYYLGEEEVNEAIKTTAIERPSELFYLNNGITAICRAARLPPSHTRKAVKLQIEGLSVVNGAQTVGSISQAASENGNNLSDDAKLLITIIEVGSEIELGKKVTRARNTQNRISSLHFAALDPQQERLRREMALLNVRYEYRPSEEEDNDIKAEEAAIAIACLRTDLTTVVTAKRQVGLLYDTEGTFYRNLFSSTLSGAQLIRLMRIYTYLNGILANSEVAETSGSRRKMFYRHSRYFLMHLLNRFNRGILIKEEIELSEADKLDLSRIITEYAEDAYTAGESIFSISGKGYLSIFRNQQDSSDLFNAFIRLRISRSASTAPSATI